MPSRSSGARSPQRPQRLAAPQSGSGAEQHVRRAARAERPDEALVQVKDSLAGFEALAAADPRNAAATERCRHRDLQGRALLESIGRRREALSEFERALGLHLGLRADDPDNDAIAAQLASDYNGLATTQAKLGMRDLSLANHGHAIDMSRRLSEENPSDIELRVALALALTGRGEAYASFGRAAGTP